MDLCTQHNRCFSCSLNYSDHNLILTVVFLLHTFMGVHVKKHTIVLKWLPSQIINLVEPLLLIILKSECLKNNVLIFIYSQFQDLLFMSLYFSPWRVCYKHAKYVISCVTTVNHQTIWYRGNQQTGELTVGLFLCLYLQSTSKRLNRSGPFFVETHLTLEKVHGWLKMTNFSWKKCRNWLYLKMRKFKNINPQSSIY